MFGFVRSTLRLGRPPTVLFVADGDTPCSEIVLEPFLVLADRGAISLSIAYSDQSRGWRLRRAARRADTLVVFRGSSPRVERVCRVARRAGVRVLWSADDDLLSIDTSNPVAAGYVSSEVRARMLRILGLSDGLWLFSPRMAAAYRRFGRPILLTAAPAPPIRMPADAAAGEFVVGHVGDWSHEPEMGPLVDMILSLDQRPLPLPCRFEFIDFTPDRLDGHPAVIRRHSIKGVSAFHNWLAGAGWSIGVAPLRDTPFNRCKTDNKFRTFAAHAIAGVYSDVACYRESVRDGETGLIVRHDAEGFREAITRLMLDPQLHRAIVAASRERLRMDYSMDALVARLLPVLASGHRVGA